MYKLLAIMAAVLVGSTAMAQPGPATFSATSKNASQPDFTDYLAKGKNTLSGRQALEKISIAGLPVTPANIAATRNLLASKISDHEKISSIRILAGMYLPDDKLGTNSAIYRELKVQANSNQREIARAATFGFSRLGYFADSDETLQHALKNQNISDDEYYGELAHIVRFAPGNEQVRFLSKIAQSRNSYSIEILANLIHEANGLKKFTPQSKKVLWTILQNNEPTFPAALGEYGFVDAFRYENWLHANATLASALTATSYNDFILERLNSPKTDPRKVIAFLSTKEGKEFVAGVGDAKKFALANEHIQQYADSFPSNVFVKELVESAGASLK
jgi:hypothetical protein